MTKNENTEAPQPGPSWLGTELTGVIVKLNIPKAKTNSGTQLLVDVAVNVSGNFKAHIPEAYLKALEVVDDEHLVRSMNLTQAGCTIGLRFGKESDPGIQIEECHLQPGLKIEIPSDPDIRELADAMISIRMNYDPKLIVYFGNHFGQLVAFRAWDHQSEQESMGLSNA